VTHQLHQETRLDTRVSHQRGEAMPGIVQPDDPDTGRAGDPGERSVQVASLDRSAVPGDELNCSGFDPMPRR
jgi:hypothetical protein